MNATKRKFNALLNGLGNKSTTSLNSELNNESTLISPNPLTPDAQAKKRRVVRPIGGNSTTPTAPRLPLLDSSTNARRHQKSQSVAATGSVLVEKPKYAPWDRQAFLERLKSFSSLTDWAPKPAKVNEVEWAKRGWVCQKSERVRCCLCNVEILVKLNKKMSEDGTEEAVYVASQIEDALVDRYADMIISSHAENCLWKKRGCDETIFKISLNHAPTTLQSIRERYDSLCALGDLLPYEHNLNVPETFDLDTVLTYFPKDFLSSKAIPILSISQTNTTPPQEPSRINRVALTLSVFGWRTRTGVKSSHATAQCESCFRNLGLWLFKSKKVDESGQETLPASVECLDVVNEHREYCPWRNPKSQSAGGKASQETKLFAAWEVVVRVLHNDSYLRHVGDAQPDKAKEKKKRPVTAIEGSGVLENPFQLDVEEDEDAKSIREEKEKERWARLRRVKSLFDTKGGRKSKRSNTIEQGKNAS